MLAQQVTFLRLRGAFLMSDSGQQPDRLASKAALRARVVAARRALTDPQRAAAAERMREVLTGELGAPELSAGPAPAAVTITGYVPFGTEPGGPELPAVLADRLPPGGRLLLPVVLPDLDLDWAIYDGRLQPGTHGPPEPAGARLGKDAVAQAALVVVPALAVDRRGLRLGRGGGSYDRALARVPPATPVIALLYDGELLLDEELPAEPHDRRVSAAVTPGLGLVELPAG